MRSRRHNDDGQLRARRNSWKHLGQARPEFALTPGPGQESVWDYPRPPALVQDTRVIEVRVGEVLIARSKRAIRVLETASPPTFYLPPGDVDQDILQRTNERSFCEWKGHASYFDIKTTYTLVQKAAWSYERPMQAFADIAGYLSFYPVQVECFVAGEIVLPQQGGFYGGWITDEIVGPFKGDLGTSGW